LSALTSSEFEPKIICSWKKCITGLPFHKKAKINLFLRALDNRLLATCSSLFFIYLFSEIIIEGLQKSIWRSQLTGRKWPMAGCQLPYGNMLAIWYCWLETNSFVRFVQACYPHYPIRLGLHLAYEVE